MNSLLGVILIDIAINIPFATFLMKNFISTVPIELEEAAKIDGAGVFRTFATITFPLLKPVVATIAILNTLNVWNDFMGPLIYLNSTKLKTIQLGIRMFISQYGADYALIMAASVCSLVPVLIVFMVCQKWFVEGITAGGVKG